MDQETSNSDWVTILGRAAKGETHDMKENINYFNLLSIRDFLYRLNTGNINDSKIKVHGCWGLDNVKTRILKKLKPICLSNLGLWDFSEESTYFHIVYKNTLFMVSILMFIELGDVNNLSYSLATISLEGEEPLLSYELIEYLKISAIATSNLKNKIIFIKEKEFKHRYLESTELLLPKDISLGNIFLPPNIESQIMRFIAEINNYSPEKREIKRQFRFLLNGLPGTGKSQIISAIINAVYGKITTVILNGADYRMTDIIDFCKIFDPCLLVIDDIDFIARKREENFNSNSLINFLHSLDGLFPESLFLIGATNDKFLVDEAASRPGRFDMILDITKIGENNYLSLIKRETDDESLIELFNEEILSFMKDKNVTGAFIVNLIKQLISIKRIEGKVVYEDLMNLLKFTYEGFYIDPICLGRAVGFK